MTWYLESLDLEVWKTILFGYTFPTKDVDGGKIRKTLDEYNEEESRKFQLNSKAIYILVCAIDRNEYNRISQCKTAKEIWRILEITHEGTTQVKDSKVRILENDYEMFKMKPNESIVEMFTRFTDVINGLEGLGKRVSEQNKVSKILRCLPPKWNSKTEAIEEANNLKELPLEELIRSLMTYEMKIARQEKEMQEESKKKSIALKAQEEKVVEEANLSNMEDDIAHITKKMQKFMMKNKFGGKTYNKRSNYKKEGPSKEEKENREGAKEVNCYKCKKPGHIKYDCPLYKAKKEKRRAMMATWSQSEDSSDDESENEFANMCFMAFEDQDKVSSDSDDNEVSFEYDELLIALYKFGENNTSLKKKIFEFKKELDEIKEKFSKVEASKISLEKVNEELLKKNEWLLSSLSKFSCGQKTFEMILASQKCVFDKRGLGYKTSNNEKYFKNYFVKESISESSSTICNFCGRGGHISSTCPLRMDPKRHQLLSQRRLGLKNQRSLTTKDPKIFGYLNLLDFFFRDQRRRNGSWTVVAQDI